MVLFDRQIVFLDRLGADIRAASGVAISRAHVIRALIDALSESDLDLTGTRSEADLKAVLTARLGRYRSRSFKAFEPFEQRSTSTSRFRPGVLAPGHDDHLPRRVLRLRAASARERRWSQPRGRGSHAPCRPGIRTASVFRADVRHRCSKRYH